MPDVREITGLDQNEVEVLEKWKESRKRGKGDSTKSPLAIDASMKLYQLYLHGYTCDEIQQDNKGFSLGQILDARVRDGWDQRRTTYTDKLFSTMYDRVRQAQFESVGFTTDLLSAAHKMYSSKLRAYMASGVEADLGDAAALIKSLDAYRKVADMLLKMTGQDKDKDRRPDMLPKTVYVNTDAAKSPGAPPGAPIVDAQFQQKALPPGTTEVLTPDMAARVLDFFADKQREKNDSTDGR